MGDLQKIRLQAILHENHGSLLSSSQRGGREVPMHLIEDSKFTYAARVTKNVRKHSQTQLQGQDHTRECSTQRPGDEDPTITASSRVCSDGVFVASIDR